MMLDYKRNNLIINLLIITSIVWISVGFFPIINIEGDSALLSAGCARLADKKIVLPPDYFYMWNMQPMVGLSVTCIKSILPNWTTEQIYSFLTVAISLIYLFLCSQFIGKLLNLKWQFCFFVLILFPESYSIAYYPNSTIFASTLFLTSLLLIFKKPRNIISILLLGIAPLFRLDVIIIYPVILMLFWLNMDFKKSLVLSMTYALPVTLIVFAGLTLLKVNPIDTIKNLTRPLYESSRSFNFISFFKVNSTFYTIPVIIMLLYGFLILLKTKKFKLISFCILPITILYFVYGDFFGGAPKHIHYLLPFTGILCAISFQHLKILFIEKNYYLPVIIISIIILQSFIGVRIYPNSKPWIGKLYSTQNPYPTLATIITTQIPNVGLLKLVFGAGQIIPTADEFMLLSGNVFTPFYWHNIKNNELHERKILKRIVDSNVDTLYFMTTQASDWALSQSLHNFGFKLIINDNQSLINPFSSNFKFIKGNSVIVVNCIEVDRNPESFNKSFSTFEKKPLYLLTNWDWQNYFINEKMTLAKPISSQISVIY